jgi:hypothetical protein
MNYQDLLAESSTTSDLIAALKEELPYLWRENYEHRTRRPTNLVRVELGTFVYIYDFYSGLEATAAAPTGLGIEDRLVGAFGTSTAPTEIRDPARIRGWVGPTQLRYGADRDKGHIFGRALGGGTDGPGINTWIQSRSLNRGWSDQGKMFRKMEGYCAKHPGIFCFSCPTYVDQTCELVGFEFGIILPDKSLWIREFEN